MIDPNDRRFTPAAVVQEARVKSEVPPASDAKATLAYWDEYRRVERARIADLQLTATEDPELGHLIAPEGLRSLGLKIGEPPTPAGLKQAEINQHLADIYDHGAEPDFVLLSPEFAYDRGLISHRRFKWLKFRQKLGGILNLSAFFGGRSAHRTVGIRPKPPIK